MINDVYAWLTDGSNWVGGSGDQALTRLYEHLLLTAVSVVMAKFQSARSTGGVGP